MRFQVQGKLMVLAASSLLLWSCFDGGTPQPPEESVSQNALAHQELQLIATLPGGSGPGEVTFRPALTEVAAGGPSAFALGPDGVIHVADVLAGRIVRVHPVEGPRPSLAALGVEDVHVGGDGTVYAFSRVTSRVVVFDVSGRERDIVEIPRTMRWVTGLCPWSNLTGDDVGLHTAHQESVPLFAADLHRGLRPGIPGSDGRMYRTLRSDGRARIEILEGRLPTSEPQDLTDPAATNRALANAIITRAPRVIVAQQIEAPVQTPVGSLVYVGASANGQIIVDVQDVVSSRPIRVNRQLRRYAPDGTLVDEIPLSRGFYTPLHELELGADGTVYIMRPDEEGLEIWAWRGDAR